MQRPPGSSAACGTPFGGGAAVVLFMTGPHYGCRAERPERRSSSRRSAQASASTAGVGSRSERTLASRRPNSIGPSSRVPVEFASAARSARRRPGGTRPGGVGVAGLAPQVVGGDGQGLETEVGDPVRARPSSSRSRIWPGGNNVEQIAAVVPLEDDGAEIYLLGRNKRRRKELIERTWGSSEA